MCEKTQIPATDTRTDVFTSKWMSRKVFTDYHVMEI